MKLRRPRHLRERLPLWPENPRMGGNFRIGSTASGMFPFGTNRLSYEQDEANSPDRRNFLAKA